MDENKLANTGTGSDPLPDFDWRGVATLMSRYEDLATLVEALRKVEGALGGERVLSIGLDIYDDRDRVTHAHVRVNAAEGIGQQVISSLTSHVKAKAARIHNAIGIDGEQLEALLEETE